MHGGTCVPIGEHMNFAKCVNCRGRRGGLHCEEKLNACEYEESQLGHPPCTNGGHCVVSPFNETQFTCLCAPGWHGVHCEIPLNLPSKRKEDACDLEAYRLGHSPCANGGHCVADTSNETTFSCLCAQGWQGPTCEVSSFKASAVVVVTSVLLLFLTIGCIVGVVCCLRIFALPKIRQVVKKQNEVELVKVNESRLSEANNLYQLSPGEILSPSSRTDTWTKRGDDSLVNLKQPSSKLNDDNDEYEYDSIFEQLKCSSTKEVPEIAEEEDNYEPINSTYDGALKSGEAICAVSNEYDEDAEDDGHLDMTLKRPLPSAAPPPAPPPDGDDYEFLCENGPSYKFSSSDLTPLTVITDWMNQLSNEAEMQVSQHEVSLTQEGSIGNSFLKNPRSTLPPRIKPFGASFYLNGISAPTKTMKIAITSRETHE
ncbi:unnamed protein product [Rodentolepis nana]|uniref:EGF-like domain-containing protein n=1 Tax=Rodentolepis nana TaxID=102285 RepID=A0A3P7VVD3_RODNA|nr:unnamed protein product [Rodentolepis nana]